MNIRERIIFCLILIFLIFLIIYSYFTISKNPHSFSWFIATIINLVLAGFVYLKNKNNVINKTFALMCTCVALWTLSVLGYHLIKIYSVAMFFGKVLRIGFLFIPSTFFHFMLALTRNINNKTKRLIYVSYSISLIFTIINYSGYFVTEMVKRNWTYFPKFGTLVLAQ